MPPPPPHRWPMAVCTGPDFKKEEEKRKVRRKDFSSSLANKSSLALPENSREITSHCNTKIILRCLAVVFQLFGAPAVSRHLCRRPAGLALRLYEFQQREVFDQPAVELTMAVGARPTLGL